MGFRKPYDLDLLDEIIITKENNAPIIWANIFENKNPLIIEVGCGNGHFLITKSKNETNNNFIGIDIKRNRLLRCREKQVKYDINNIKWVWGEALASLDHLFKNKSIKEIYMPFSDPWPKRRHQKNRMFNSAFINIINDKLITKGLFFFITDHEEYYQASLKLLVDDMRFDLKIMDQPNNSGFGFSLFGEKWKKDKRDFFAFELIKK